MSSTCKGGGRAKEKQNSSSGWVYFNDKMMTEELWQAWNLIKQNPAEFIGWKAGEQCPNKRKGIYDQKFIPIFQEQMDFFNKYMHMYQQCLQIEQIYRVERNIPTNFKLFSLYLTPLG